MESKRIYHEKQSRELCALHALNNLFQCEVFTETDLDVICKQLSRQRPENSSFTRRFLGLNPHKSFFGGNYDVNVILTALEKLDMTAIWWDKRKPIESINYETIFGLIVNVRMSTSTSLLGYQEDNRHWIAVKQINGMFVNLDSKDPEILGNVDCLKSYLTNLIILQDAELLIIVDKNIYDAKSWAQYLT